MPFSRCELVNEKQRKKQLFQTCPCFVSYFKRHFEACEEEKVPPLLVVCSRSVGTNLFQRAQASVQCITKSKKRKWIHTKRERERSKGKETADPNGPYKTTRTILLLLLKCRETTTTTTKLLRFVWVLLIIKRKQESALFLFYFVIIIKQTQDRRRRRGREGRFSQGKWESNRNGKRAKPRLENKN